MDMVPMSDGARLATWVTPGPARNPPVILVHGGPGLWDYLEPVGSLLSHCCTVHRYDQRGCGRSSASGDLTMERFVADLEELRLTFGYPGWVLIGHSFGASLALAYAGTHPDRVVGLGFLSGVGVGDWRSAYRAERDRRLAPFSARFAELDGRERTAAEEIEWRRISWATDYADVVAGYDLALPMAEAPHPINHVANRSLTFEDMDQITWATAVRCPVTFVHGTADPRPMGPIRALAAHTRAPRKRVVDGAGHLPWVEHPEQVREILHEIVISARSRA